VPFKWVSKSWVFRIPFIGWNMAMNRYIKLAGDDRKSILKAFRGADRALSNGNSVFFFPEGTRSETGVTEDFKPGAFVLAMRQKLPILPIAISGASKALPKGSLNFHGRHKIKIKVLDEVAYDDYAGLSSDEAAKKVRDMIAVHVDENREEGNV
jgi:1-acyl-sn-glycerol-3-phosphate acyltransferase